MNKKTLTLITIFFILLINLSKSNAHKKIHNRNNYVYFIGDAHLVTFTLTNHCISPEQSFRMSDDIGSKDLYYHRINIIAGRHASRDTVQCVEKNLFQGSKLIPSFFDSNFTFFAYYPPEKFNFAVKGTLTINHVPFDEIILIQGHSLLKNNWWFGGNQCDHHPKAERDEVTCTARNKKKWCFTRGKAGPLLINNSNEVEVKKHTCH